MSGYVFLLFVTLCVPSDFAVLFIVCGMSALELSEWSAFWIEAVSLIALAPLCICDSNRRLLSRSGVPGRASGGA